MRDKTIAITGHSGIIGSNFLNKFKNNKYIRCDFDIRNRKKVFQWIKDNEFDIFLHLAAIVPIKKVNQDKTKTHKINFNGTKNIVDAINKYKKGNVWLFYSSTSHVYGSSKNLKPFREISKAFKLFDEDNTGRINLRNLRRIAREMQENLSDDEL